MNVPDCARGFAARLVEELVAGELELEDPGGWLEEAVPLVSDALASGRPERYQPAVLVAARRSSAYGAAASPLDVAIALHGAVAATARATGPEDPMAAPAAHVPDEIDLSLLEPAEASEPAGPAGGGEGGAAEEGQRASAEPADSAVAVEDAGARSTPNGGGRKKPRR